MTKRNEILSELQSAKNALIASERRSKRATTKLRQLEKLLGPLTTKMRLWTAMPVADNTNAARLLTVGECRALLAVLDSDTAPAEPEENVDSDCT